MRIQVLIKIDDDTQEVYGFNMFDLTAVFVTYHKEIKPKGKRKWTIVNFWDKYGRNSTVPEPELPEVIKHYALVEIQKYISVKTWAQFKPNS